MKQPFEGLLDRAGFVFAIACATTLTSGLLAYAAYLRLAIHNTGQGLFAAGGAVLAALYASVYFRDAQRLRRNAKDTR